MESTVLVANALLFVVTGYALGRDKSRYGHVNSAVALLLIVIIVSMVFDNIAYNIFDIEHVSRDHTSYNMIQCALFIAMFGVFYNTQTKIRCRLAGCMAIQALASWMNGVNGATISGYVLFDSDNVLYCAQAISWLAWAIEIWILIPEEVEKARLSVMAKLNLHKSG